MRHASSGRSLLLVGAIQQLQRAACSSDEPQSDSRAAVAGRHGKAGNTAGRERPRTELARAERIGQQPPRATAAQGSTRPGGPALRAFSAKTTMDAIAGGGAVGACSGGEENGRGGKKIRRIFVCVIRLFDDGMQTSEQLSMTESY